MSIAGSYKHNRSILADLQRGVEQELKMSTTRLTRYLQVVATALIPMTSSALGAVLNGADHGNGSIDNIAYGATGLVSLTPLLFVKAVGSTEDPNVIASSTDLSFSYRVTG